MKKRTKMFLEKNYAANVIEKERKSISPQISGVDSLIAALPGDWSSPALLAPQLELVEVWLHLAPPRMDLLGLVMIAAPPGAPPARHRQHPPAEGELAVGRHPDGLDIQRCVCTGTCMQRGRATAPMGATSVVPLKKTQHVYTPLPSSRIISSNTISPQVNLISLRLKSRSLAQIDQ